MRIRPCPVAKWPGTLTLHDQVSYPDLIAFDDAQSEAEQYLGAPIPDQPGYLTIVDVNRYRLALLPGLLHFVEACDLKGIDSPLTVNNFPAIPRPAAAQLFAWLRDCVQEILLGIDDDPKASEPLKMPIALGVES